MDIIADDLEVVDNRSADRFEAHVGDEVAFLTYRRGGGTIAFIHTEVPESLEGHGIAARLARHGLDYARAKGLDVVPICPYVAAYIKSHPEYQELVAPRPKWREFLPASR